jgi:hypothetical protein
MDKFRECRRECLRVLVLLTLEVSWGWEEPFKLGTDNESWVWVWAEEGAVVGNNESILPLPFPIEAVLTCCPGKAGESGEDNEGANDDTDPPPLEWERACPNEVERNGDEGDKGPGRGDSAP